MPLEFWLFAIAIRVRMRYEFQTGRFKAKFT